MNNCRIIDISNRWSKLIPNQNNTNTNLNIEPYIDSYIYPFRYPEKDKEDVEKQLLVSGYVLLYWRYVYEEEISFHIRACYMPINDHLKNNKVYILYFKQVGYKKFINDYNLGKMIKRKFFYDDNLKLNFITVSIDTANEDINDDNFEFNKTRCYVSNAAYSVLTALEFRKPKKAIRKATWNRKKK